MAASSRRSIAASLHIDILKSIEERLKSRARSIRIKFGESIARSFLTSNNTIDPDFAARFRTMGEPLVEWNDDAVADAEIDFGLEPDEVLIWSGRPKSPLGRILALFRKNRVANVAGAIIAVLVCAIGMRWKNITPIIIYSMYLFIFLFSMTLFHVRLKGSRYALTNERALIVEPSLKSTGSVTRSWSPLALRLLRREDHADGTGDLLFERTGLFSKSNGGFPNLFPWYGFLGIEDAEHVEELFRTTLLGKDRVDAYPFTGVATFANPKNDADEPMRERKVYRLTEAARTKYESRSIFGMVPHVAAGVFWFFGICGTAFSTMALIFSIPSLFLIAGRPEPHRFAMLGMFFFMLLMSLFVIGIGAVGFKESETAGPRQKPPEIEIGDDGLVFFDFGAKAFVIPVSEIVRVELMLHPTIVHRTGKVQIKQEFEHFHDFLATLKTLNPTIEFKGL